MSKNDILKMRVFNDKENNEICIWMSRSTRNPAAFPGIKGNQLFYGEDLDYYSLAIDILIFLNHFSFEFLRFSISFKSIKSKV